MKQWTSLRSIRQTLEKQWNRGVFLREAVQPRHIFPLVISLHSPTSAHFSDRFDEARTWISQFTQNGTNPHFDVKWKTVNHRVLGNNSIPFAVVFTTPEQLAGFLGKTRDVDLFTKLSGILLRRFPQFVDWIARKPFTLINHAPDIHKLINVAAWIGEHPQPDRYIRQMTIPDIDTKFVERHKLLLTQWLDTLLDPSDIDDSHSGVKGFEKRYGFRSKPPLVRFRFLDRELYINGLSDLSIPSDDFCTLQPPVETVFVTENDINALVFPEVKQALVLFGRGYGFDFLKHTYWLKDKKIRYWGDIDTHGFAILNQFRTIFPQTESMLMDRATLLAHQNLWVREKTPATGVLHCLTNEEYSLYRELTGDKHGCAVRLEQEAISFERLTDYLNNLNLR